MTVLFEKIWVKCSDDSVFCGTNKVFINIIEFSWQWFTSSELKRCGCLGKYSPINHSCFACSIWCHDNQAHPNNTRNFSVNQQTLKAKTDITHTKAAVQGEPCSITNWFLPAGQTHWASAPNSCPVSPILLLLGGVLGASGLIITWSLSPSSLDRGPPKQWCNTRQIYVTNLHWQSLTPKHRRWRLWKHSPQKLDCDPDTYTLYLCLHVYSGFISGFQRYSSFRLKILPNPSSPEDIVSWRQTAALLEPRSVDRRLWIYF